MSNIYTSAMYQDKDGFLWVGTVYGLNRYDGYQFKQIKRGEIEIDKHNLIYKIAGGDADNLWLFYNIKGRKEIEVLDTKTEKSYNFKTYYEHPLPFEVAEITELSVQDVKDRPWIVTEKGVLYLFQNQRFIKIFQTNNNQSISAVTIDENDNIFIGVDKQLIQTDFKGNIKSSTDFEHPIRNIWIDEEKAWIETRASKRNNLTVTLWEKSITKERIKKFYSFNVAKFKELNSILIYPIDKNFLIIENEEIFIINHQKEKVKDLSDLLYKTTFIGAFNIFYNQNILWIGLSSGIIKIQQRPQKIKVVHRYIDQSSDCRGITEDELGNIYFNNIKGYQYNPKSGNINIFREKEGAFSLHYYDNTFYSALYNPKFLGLLTDLNSKKTRHIPNINGGNALSIIETNQKGELLIGTQKGLIFSILNH
ncbi:MAG: ligand-binding sensor domain-containing protein [Cognaticolwellia sp.]